VKLTAAIARRTWSYDPSSGILRYKVRGGSRKAIGDQAGTISNGRRLLSFWGTRYIASRVIWLIVKGRWPKNEIDHKNRNPLDERWTNLRHCSRRKNGYNRDSGRKNKTGYLGVHQQSKLPGRVVLRYYGSVMIRGEKRRTKRFDTAVEAAIARDALAKQLHGEFARLNFS